MIILFMIIILLLLSLLFLFGYYYFLLLRRFYFIFRKRLDKKFKYIFIFLGFCLSILTINLFGITGIFLIHFIFISVFLDMIVFIISKFRKKYDININRYLLYIYKSSIIPIILTAMIFGYGYFNIRNVIETKYTVYTDKEIKDDIRILLITDVHYETIFGKDKLNDYKSKLDRVDADIIVLGGDIVDESTTSSGMKDIFSTLGSVKNKYGIYYVYGNHDEQQYSNSKNFSKKELDEVITNNNIKIMDDDYFIANNDIIIVGRKDFSSRNRKRVNEIINGIDDSKYVIMVDHQPVEYDENIEAKIDLILSGHTHAGQIFPIKFFIDLFHTADFSYGEKKFTNMEAIVSSGMAGWGYPIRTEKHSEYVIIDVKTNRS